MLRAAAEGSEVWRGLASEGRDLQKNKAPFFFLSWAADYVTASHLNNVVVFVLLDHQLFLNFREPVSVFTFVTLSQR